MSIFGAIRDAIFGGPAEAAPAAAAQPPTATTTKPDKRATPAAPGSATPAAPGSATVAPVELANVDETKVDVAAILDKLNKENPEKLDWRHSIVDLMKLLNLESSLHARRELANELGYDGDPHKSAEMNIWLHKQVMTKLAEHGGIVPDELKH